MCLFGSLSPSMATWNRWHEGYECTVIFRAKDYGVIVKPFHRILFSTFVNIKLLCNIRKEIIYLVSPYHNLESQVPLHGCQWAGCPVSSLSLRQPGPRARTRVRSGAPGGFWGAARMKLRSERYLRWHPVLRALSSIPRSVRGISDRLPEPLSWLAVQDPGGGQSPHRRLKNVGWTSHKIQQTKA